MKKIKLIRSFLFVFIGTILLFGCSKARKFNRMGWNDGDGLTYNNRDVMLDDLLATHKLKGMKYWTIVGLLHDPQGSNRQEGTFYYEIIHKFNGIKPVHIKTLIFYMTKDSVITKTKIYDKDYTLNK